MYVCILLFVMYTPMQGRIKYILTCIRKMSSQIKSLSPAESTKDDGKRSSNKKNGISECHLVSTSERVDQMWD